MSARTRHTRIVASAGPDTSQPFASSLAQLQAPPNQLTALRSWAAVPPTDESFGVHYPSLTCFSVFLEKMTLKGPAHFFAQYRFDISFGGVMANLRLHSSPHYK